MNKSTGLFLGLSVALSLGLADICQADAFTGRYNIVSEPSDGGGSITGYIEFEDAPITNKLALPREYERGVKEVSITYTNPGMDTLTVNLSHYRDLAGLLSFQDIIGFDGLLGAPVLTPMFHNPIRNNASWEFYGDLNGDGQARDFLKLFIFNMDGDITTPGQTRWAVKIDDIINNPDLGTDWALRTFSPVWWLVLDTGSDGSDAGMPNADDKTPELAKVDQHETKSAGLGPGR